MPSTDAAPLPLRCSTPGFAQKNHMMVSISTVSRGGSAVSWGECGAGAWKIAVGCTVAWKMAVGSREALIALDRDKRFNTC